MGWSKPPITRASARNRDSKSYRSLWCFGHYPTLRWTFRANTLSMLLPACRGPMDLEDPQQQGNNRNSTRQIGNSAMPIRVLTPLAPADARWHAKRIDGQTKSSREIPQGEKRQRRSACPFTCACLWMHRPVVVVTEGSFPFPKQLSTRRCQSPSRPGCFDRIA